MRKASIIVVIVIILALLVPACAQPSPTQPAPATTTAAKPATLQPQKWTYIPVHTSLEPVSDQLVVNAFNRIKKRTNGTLEIIASPYGALPIKSGDLLRAVSKGQIEMGQVNNDWNAGDFPLFGVVNVPYINQNDYEKALMMRAINPIFERELNKMNVHIISMMMWEPAVVVTNAPANLMDLKKMKIRTNTKGYAMMFEAMNGVPTPVDFAEVYTAMQRGVVNGGITGISSVTSSKWMEVAPYSYNLALNTLITYLSVSKDKWDALPQDIKDIVTEELNFASLSWTAYQSLHVAKEVASQQKGGLKGWEPNVPAGFLDLMSEKVTKPLLKEELAKTGALGQEVLSALEESLGRKLQ